MLYQENLQRVIIEPTNRCNLDCSICLRQSWEGEPGSMTAAVFAKLISDLAKCPSLPEVFFGGFGEPLSHPRILDMINQAAALGSRTTLITNGTLLNDQLVSSLLEAGLNKLWISIDGSHQQAVNQSKSKEQQTGVLKAVADMLLSGNINLEQLEPGLSMVHTSENQEEILALIEQGRNLGLRSFFITNIEAYTPAQAARIPYSAGQRRRPELRRDFSLRFLEHIQKLSANDVDISIAGIVNNHQPRCPFAERGDLVLRWDGEISYCLPLLYNRTIFLTGWEQKQYAHSLGNITENSLNEIWTGSSFRQHQERLLNQEYSPCLGCRDCWLSEDNRRDCMGFEHPACGGCLWAAGLVNCP